MDQPRFFSLAALGKSHPDSPDLDSPDLAEWLHLSSDDDNGRAVVEAVEQAWQPWKPRLRRQLLFTVECIVEAENAKQAWKDRDPETDLRYKELARSAIHAAELASQIAAWVPLPRDDNSFLLITLLAEWAVSGLNAMFLDRDHALQLAGSMIDRLRDDLKTAGHHLSYELLGRLASLATGRQEPFHESTMRRYGKDVTPTAPAADVWIENWDWLIEVARLSPNAEQANTFTDIMRAFLHPRRPH